MPSRSLRVVAFAFVALALTVTSSAALPAPPAPPMPPAPKLPHPPAIALPAPPQVVVVPNSPVYYAPGVSFNLFVYGGRYYTLHDGSWFYAKSHSGPWVFIAPGHVPKPVIAVPTPYYKIPPGRAKKTGPPIPGPAGYGPSAPGCPPGQAKKGRC